MWTRLRSLIPDRRGLVAADDAGFPTQGTQSVGVKRQYCGALGKTGNCQVGVSTALIGPTLVWPTSCERHLPQEWAVDAARREKARVPPTVRFREKWRIGLAPVRQRKKAGVEIDAVVADADYRTTTACRTGLERMGLRDGVAVRGVLHAWLPGATTSRSRWATEQPNRELQDELGLDHFGGRTYPGWAHHTVFTAAAFTLLQLERRRSLADPRTTLPAVRAWMRKIAAILYVVGNDHLFNLALSFRRNPPLRR